MAQGDQPKGEPTLEMRVAALEDKLAKATVWAQPAQVGQGQSPCIAAGQSPCVAAAQSPCVAAGQQSIFHCSIIQPHPHVVPHVVPQVLPQPHVQPGINDCVPGGPGGVTSGGTQFGNLGKQQT